MPKIEGTRKQLAEELKARLTRGPSFSSMHGEPAYTPEEAARQYQRWAQSWILEPLCKLIPELKGRG
jgi:hypothetical protein